MNRITLVRLPAQLQFPSQGCAITVIFQVAFQDALVVCRHEFLLRPPSPLPSCRHLSTTPILVAPSPSECCPLSNKLIYYISILNFMNFSVFYDVLSPASLYIGDYFGHSRIYIKSNYIKCSDTRRYTRRMYRGRLMRVDGKLARVIRNLAQVDGSLA
ncbi:hypothetical protein K503DRAFT_406105 [Rhizopogon vinicolor AM-OR11-026]|uniref:Uncharacterized protein n=1 Tax=Rhizopogon vinicolor AM-OR11-026 TaxID=1314800 RepID=A0A1B7MQR0_9AGAM|nr:hypothetical protein K503DRAFT_406105 [Rhizopogon vinicolor AM-OR11-026]